MKAKENALLRPIDYRKVYSVKQWIEVMSFVALKAGSALKIML